MTSPFAAWASFGWAGLRAGNPPGLIHRETNEGKGKEDRADDDSDEPEGGDPADRPKSHQGKRQLRLPADEKGAEDVVGAADHEHPPDQQEDPLRRLPGQKQVDPSRDP